MERQQAELARQRLATLIEEKIGRDPGGVGTAPQISLEIESVTGDEFEVVVKTNDKRVWALTPLELEGVKLRLVELG